MTDPGEPIASGDGEPPGRDAGEPSAKGAGPPSAPGVGRVYLVGAGPGDAGLLTARALKLIATADVILYDRLIPDTALDGARADAELLFAGKQGGGESVPQEQTEAWLVEHARAGRSVVRLKGGDPFVFGRGGEEALTLRAAGIPFEVVSGRHRRRCRARLRGHPGYAPRPLHGGRVRHRAHGRRLAARLGGARRFPRHARLLHGRGAPGAHRPVR